MKISRFALAAAAALFAVFVANAFPEEQSLEQRRKRSTAAYQEGNYRDAYEGFRALALDPKDDPTLVGQDLSMATQALADLGRVEEIDAFREAVIDVHSKNWRLLQAAADNYMNREHYGFIIAGKFYRGSNRGGGREVNSFERDRIRALQLMVRAIPLTKDDPAKSEVAGFYLSLSRLLLGNRGYADAWRLQYPSDLSQLPDYEEGWYYGRETTGAPVDADGNPVYHHVPKSFDTAASDGERWRWALVQAMEASPDRLNEVRTEFANFLHNQFGVQTMAYYGAFMAMQEKDDEKRDESGTYALHTLGEDETIARLASGVKRFKLPEEFNYIKIYQQIADDPKTGHADEALQTLAQIFENRRQYPKAAEYWRRGIKEYGDPNNTKQARLKQIVDNWGRFEPIMTQPAGQGATVEFRFRNGQRVEFEAHPIKVDKLLADVKAYIKSKPNQIDWQKINIADLGYRFVQEKQKEYLGDRVALWTLDLEPRPEHFDKRITVSTPLQKAGAYLLKAKMADGNTSQIILWLADTAIVKKPLDGKTYYYVGDAVDGRPIPNAKLDFFGYKQMYVSGTRYNTEIQQFTEKTDADGQLLHSGSSDFQWVITASTPGGRLAYLGFTGMWTGQWYDSEYNQTKVFTITDRPVYRPGQPVKFKLWVRNAKYDQEDTSSFANQKFTVEILNPKSEKIFTQELTADAYGGLESEFAPPSDATLGVYNVNVVNYGGGNFRVEEYKKPEFEVTVDAPSKPVMLGEKITATIKAKYYFGSPVVNAQVKYKVMRTTYSSHWYPAASWDWLYGSGYWW